MVVGLFFSIVGLMLCWFCYCLYNVPNQLREERQSRADKKNIAAVAHFYYIPQEYTPFLLQVVNGVVEFRDVRLTQFYSDYDGWCFYYIDGNKVRNTDLAQYLYYELVYGPPVNEYVDKKRLESAMKKRREPIANKMEKVREECKKLKELKKWKDDRDSY